jgi:dynein heavy chain
LIIYRVLFFQAWFEDLMERFETCSSGESLFGLESTEYPILYKRKRELNLLQKLYSLYLQVMRSVDGYYEIPWLEIDTDMIISELTDFQNRSALKMFIFL